MALTLLVDYGELYNFKAQEEGVLTLEQPQESLILPNMRRAMTADIKQEAELATRSLQEAPTLIPTLTPEREKAFNLQPKLKALNHETKKSHRAIS